MPFQRCLKQYLTVDNKRKRLLDLSSNDDSLNFQGKAIKLPQNLSPERDVEPDIAVPHKLALDLPNAIRGLSENIEEYTMSVIKSLEEAVNDVLEGNMLRIYVESLYKSCEDMCTYGHAPEIYDMLCDKLVSKMKEYTEELEKPSTVSLVELLANIWTSVSCKSRILNHIFMYLERFYMYKRLNEETIPELVFSIFKREVLKSNIMDVLIDDIISIVIKEREMCYNNHANVSVDRNSLRTLSQMFDQTSCYLEIFEVRLICNTNEYYRSLAEKINSQFNNLKDYSLDTLFSYFDLLNRMISDEKNRCGDIFGDCEKVSYVKSQTEKYLLHSLNTKAINQVIKPLISMCFNAIGLERIIETDTLYRKCKDLNKIQEFSNGLENNIAKIVTDIVTGDNIVDQISDFYRCLKITLESFCRENFYDLNTKLRNIIKGVVLKDEVHNNFFKHVVMFLDQKLRKDSKTCKKELYKSDMIEFMELMSPIMHDDVFKDHYTMHLSRRLLFLTTVGIKEEFSMIDRLESSFGEDFVKDMKVIVHDFHESTKHSEKYTNLMSDQVTYFVSLLTPTAWPNIPSIEIKVPPILNKFRESFQDFYSNIHPKRKLRWANYLDHYTIDFHSNQETYTLIVSTIQLSVIIMLDETQNVIKSNILRALGVPEDLLEKDLDRLLKIGLVNCVTIDDRSVYSINTNFSHKSKLLKLCTLKIDVPSTSTKNNIPHLNPSFLIDSMIFCILKKKKKAQREVLEKDILFSSKIKLDIENVRERIDYMISNGLVRQQDDKSWIYY